MKFKPLFLNIDIFPWSDGITTPRWRKIRCVNKHEKWHCDRIFFINIRRLFYVGGDNIEEISS